MTKTFLEVDNQYNELSHFISEVLQKLGKFCSNITEDKAELFTKDSYGDIYNPFEIGYNEEYESHYIRKDLVHVEFGYKDGYDDILDSSSTVEYPINWVEAAMSDDLESIETQVVSVINQRNLYEIEKQKDNIKRLAIEYGLIKEENK